MDVERPPQASPDSTDPLEWADSVELPTEEVRDVFLVLTKALRAAQLYDAGNPVYKRFLASLRDSFVRVWESRDRLQILVQEDRLLWMGEEVYRNESRADSLSFLLYRDGIRDLTFMKGVEEEELPRLLTAVARAKGQKSESDDLVTILWDLDLRFVSHSAVDLGLEGVDLLGSMGQDPRRDPGLPRAVESLRGELEAAVSDSGEEGEEPQDAAGTGGRSAAGVVSTEDFNPTLYALDESERRQVKAAVRAEMERDLRTDVLNALLDSLEEAGHPQRQIEILEILRTLLPTFLSQSALGPAARLVSELRAIRDRGGLLDDDGIRIADQLLAELSSPGAVQELIRALADGSVGADSVELSALLRCLGPEALETLVLGSETALEGEGRGALQHAMNGIAEANREAVTRLLSASNPAVVRGAVRLVGQLRLDEAAGAVAELIERGAPEIRLAAVEAAAELRAPVLAGALVRSLTDGARDLRVAAARVLGGTGYPPAARELRRILEGKGIRSADVTEKVTLFEAYGLLAGEEAVEFLSEILNGKGFLGRREPSEMRAGAAMGLGKVDSRAAEHALRVASSDDDPVVRSAVGRALRGEGKSRG